MTLLGMLCTFGFEALIIKKFGLSTELDIFFAAYTYVMLCLSISIAIKVGAVPFLSKELCDAKTNQLVSSLLILTAMVGVVIWILVSEFAGPISFSLAAGAGPEALYHIYKIIILVGPLFLVQGLSSVFSAFLASKEIFWASSSQALFRAVFAFVYVVSFETVDLYVVYHAILIGSVLELLIVFFLSMHLANFRLAILKFENFKYSWDFVLSVAVVLPGVGLRYLPIIAQKFIASYLGEGAISLVSIASRLQGPMMTLFAGSTIAATTPRIAKAFSVSPIEVHELLVECFKKLFLVITPVSLSVSTVAFFIHQFSDSFAWRYHKHLDALLVMFIIFSLGLFGRAFFAYSSTIFLCREYRLLYAQSFIVLTIGELIMMAGFVHILGVIGIAIANSISLLFFGLIYIIVCLNGLQTRFISLIFMMRGIFLKATVLCFVMYYVLVFVVPITLFENAAIDFSFKIAASLVMYFALYTGLAFWELSRGKR